MRLVFWIQVRTDILIKILLHLLIEQQSATYVTRFAITFLDAWQAFIIVNHNYWIPQLVDITAPIQYYIVFSEILAIFAIMALILHRVLWMTAVVFAINFLLYLLIMVSSIWYYDPPRASAGFAFFVMLISLASFWRICLLIMQERMTYRTE